MAAPWVGLSQCAEHSVGGTTFLAFDKVNSGTLGRKGGEVEHSVGAGGQSTKWRKPVDPDGSVKCDLQSIGLLVSIIPTAIGVHPVIAKIHGGPVTDAGARLHTGCQLTRVKLSCAKPGIILVEYDWAALTDTAVTIATAVTKQANTPFPWHNMDVQIGGASYKCENWEAEFQVPLRPEHSLDLKTAGSQRVTEWIDPADFMARFNASVRVPVAMTHDFLSDYPDMQTFKVVAKNSDSTPKTFTLDMTGGSGLDAEGNMPMPIAKGPEAVLFRIGGVSNPNDLSIVTFTLA